MFESRHPVVGKALFVSVADLPLSFSLPAIKARYEPNSARDILAEVLYLPADLTAGNTRGQLKYMGNAIRNLIRPVGNIEQVCA